MATVVRQMLELDFGDAYRCVLYPTTASTRRETIVGRLRRHLGALSDFRNTLRTLRPAIVHLHTCSGFSFHRTAFDLRAAHRMGIPTALHVHGAAFDSYARSAGPVGRMMIRRALTAATRVIALSKSWMAELQRLAPQARVVAIENAVAEHRPALPRPQNESASCRFLLLARMDLWKGVDDLLSAAYELRGAGREFELVLAGPEGTAGDVAVLQRKIAHLGLSGCVRYVGTVAGDRKADLLEWADVYVQPSHHEGLPVAVLEALAAGRPVIATRVGALPEVFEDGRNGLLIEPHRPRQLAAAMRRLLEDVEFRNALGQAGRKLARHRFGLARLAAQLSALYDEVLEVPAKTCPSGVVPAPRGAERMLATPASA